jgi:hypothetical protein
MRANERARDKSHEFVGGRIAQEFPWDAVGFADGRGDFDARVGQVISDARPEVACVCGLEDLLEQRFTDGVNVRFDATSDNRGGVCRVDQVIFEIPAEVLLLLVGQGEGERGCCCAARVANGFQLGLMMAGGDAGA